MNLAQRMVAQLPRYDWVKGKRDVYRTTGKHVVTNVDVLPRAEASALHKAMDASDCLEKRLFTVKYVDVSKAWALHRSVYFTHLNWLAKNLKWQNWSELTRGGRPKSLPYVVKYAGVLIVWNGTHRTTICRILGIKLRCKFVDLDAIVKADARGKRTKSAKR